jgi:NADPH:quinone reductase-like Zn-dependent oxidoreductase
MADSMRAYQFVPDGTAYRLEQITRTIPVPGPGRALVKVRAASLNYRDLINLRNKFGRKVDGKVPLSDGAGVVVALGDGVSRVKVGDRVAGIFFQTWHGGRFDFRHHQSDLGGSIDGMLTEYADMDAEGLVRVPEYLTDEEASCLPCAAVTAWYSLMTRGGIRSGDSILALGTGGVSVFALQFGVALGCPVFVTSGSDEKLTRAKALGATHTINYKTTPDWDKEVWRLSGKRGVDHVIEVGGGGTLGKSLACVAAGGHVALIGVLTGFGPPKDSLFPLLARNATMNGIYVGSRDDFEAMNRFLSVHKVRPVIDRMFPFDRADDAFQYLESGSHFGKVVIQF